MPYWCHTNAILMPYFKVWLHYGYSMGRVWLPLGCHLGTSCHHLAKRMICFHHTAFVAGSVPPRNDPKRQTGLSHSCILNLLIYLFTIGFIQHSLLNSFCLQHGFSTDSERIQQVGSTTMQRRCNNDAKFWDFFNPIHFFCTFADELVLICPKQKNIRPQKSNNRLSPR